MGAITDFFHRLSNLPELIQWAGSLGLMIIIFSETGLLVGVFLPGDSLLVTAGLLCAQGYFNVYELAPLLTIAAICGNSTGYFIGRTSGPRIFRRDDSLFFNKKHAIRAHEFYERYGKKTIIIAQFMPIIRTFSPVVAGVGVVTLLLRGQSPHNRRRYDSRAGDEEDWVETVGFTRMADGTAEDYALLARYEEPFMAELPDRLLNALHGLKGSLAGYQVSRYEHSLQSATRAHQWASQCFGNGGKKKTHAQH